MPKGVNFTPTSYLGLIISEQGVATYPQKIAANINWKKPKNIIDFRGFLGR
jgi:hypothetical protein